MTIIVSIENTDKERAVEVIEIAIDKKSGRRTEGAPYRVAPGCKTSVAVYLLRDVLVREIDPVPH